MINLTQDAIMQNWEADNSDIPLVSVKCMAYNHEKYISQTIDGFLMQKTTFPFEVLIHDDASTDRTANIIREYELNFPKIVKGIYETENQWSKGNKANHVKIDAAIKGKYIALCEGDDYWTDDNKLQIQVDFLENNQDYGLTYTKAKLFLQKENTFQNGTGEFCDNFTSLLEGNKVPTLTACLRTKLYNNYLQEIQPNTRNWKMGDYPMWLYIAHESKIKFFDFYSGVYRVLENSASHYNDDINKYFAFEKSREDIQEFFAEKYGVEHERKSDEWILFYVYVAALKRTFKKETAEKLRYYYSKINTPSLKQMIYNRFAFSRLFWKLI